MLDNSHKINVLFVSIAFPPKSDSEGLQVAKYYKYLQRDNSLNIDVITSGDKTLFMPIDENLKSISSGYKQIIKIPIFENKYINYLLRKINPNILNYPDSKYRFHKKWKKVINQLQSKPDIIYSRSFPISSTVMAYRLQTELDIPWILHLSDPWTVSPIHQLGTAKAWNNEMESKCFKKANILTFTSLKTIELYAKKYPELADKMVLSPNVFDLEDKKDFTFKLKNKISVVYTGGLVDKRSPETFFEAIIELNKTSPEIISDFEFVFAGALDRKNKALFKNNIPSVQHKGLLSYKDAISLQEQADILLIIDTPFENSNEAIFFPSKLLDYMMMQRRIIALTDKNSTTWDVVDKKLGDCFIHRDIKMIKKAIVSSWNAWKNQDVAYFFNNKLDFRYSAKKNAKDLSKLFKKVLNEI